MGELEKEQQTLSFVEQRLSNEIEAFFARQEVLAARYSTAEAQVQINEALSGISEELEGLGVALEHVERTTESMQARVTAIDQLVESGILDTPMRPALSTASSELAGDESSEDVEERLAALKSELGVG